SAPVASGLLPARFATRTSPGTTGDVPPHAPDSALPPASRTEDPGARTLPDALPSPDPSIPVPWDLPISPFAIPACSRKTRSDLQSLSSSVPQSDSPPQRPAGRSTSTTIPETLPASP